MGLRLQALLLSSLLIVVPALGYVFVLQYKRDLRSGQQAAMAREAHQLAVTITKSAPIVTLLRGLIEEGDDIYAYELTDLIDVDGKPDDWQRYTDTVRHVGENGIISAQPGWTEQSLSFDLIAGANASDLYLLLKVTDDKVIYREAGSLSVHRNDHVQIALVRPDGTFRRYTFAPIQPGPAAAFLVNSASEGGRALREDASIEAWWLPTGSGYNIEVRIPRELISARLSIAVTDVDNIVNRIPIATVGTGNTTERDQLGAIFIPPDDVAAMLAAIGGAGSRVRLIDKHGRLVAENGDIQSATGIWNAKTKAPQPLEEATVNSARFSDQLVTDALSGSLASEVRRSADGNHTILATAVPIRMDSVIMDRTIGALLVEQTTDGIDQMGRDLLESVMAVSLVVVAAGVVLIFIYVSLIARRARRLGIALEESIDTQGRVKRKMETNTAADEIGDLARGFATVVGRLHQYNRYLEDMSKRLAHELRTPVTVIRSSLDNLAMQDPETNSDIYVKRAQEGVERLAAILTNMTEATRLEESLDPAESEYFDITEVVSGCVEGYRIAYPQATIELSIEADFEKFFGLPELIAQMLDKLVGNAVEFAEAGTPVRLRLTLESGDIVLRVINSGPPLPAAIEDRLFDSMTSVRSGKQESGSHLGLGLYIARVIAEFHGGAIAAHNREDAEGVVVSVTLPTLRMVGRR